MSQLRRLAGALKPVEPGFREGDRRNIVDEDAGSELVDGLGQTVEGDGPREAHRPRQSQ